MVADKDRAEISATAEWSALVSKLNFIGSLAPLCGERVRV